jgi:hypothetical protein
MPFSVKYNFIQLMTASGRKRKVPLTTFALSINWFARPPLLLIIPIRNTNFSSQIQSIKVYISIMLQQKRSVQFRSIEILEFAYTVGDNPSVRSGVPLSMEWIHQMKTVIPLCFFESHRPPRSRGECGPRRLSSRHREKVLLRNGCSIQDMTTAARDALRIQEERAFTSYQLQTQKLMRSRRKREINEGPAEVTTPPSRISIEAIRKKPPADRSPVLPQRFPSSPVTVSPRAADKEKLYARLSPMMLQRPCLTRLIARSAVHC